MKYRREFVQNRKAVSSLFTTIYIALLIVILLSTLFIGMELSSSGIFQYLRIEQERSQESIRLFKLTTDRWNTLIVSLEVINTGAISVRIKALYIGHRLICDPSDPSILGDRAYIRPKENVSIPLVQFGQELNPTTLNAQWTVTTERGTKSSEKGMTLWGSTGGAAYTPNKFYFGPLMILFDMFHWKSGNGHWVSGWTIPKNTRSVAWRIFLTNVDNRSITITEDSGFTLVGNDNEPSGNYLAWYVDPPNSNMTFIPGELVSVIYAWSKPYSQGGSSSQDLTKLQESTTCKNFLTFTGHFTEQNGSQTPFGQTIPFEAVLITGETMPSLVTLTPNPANIRNDGTSYSTITATVTDSAGRPVANTWVDFYTTTGTLSVKSQKTDANGIVQVNLTSTTQQTTATVYAISQGVIGNCKVNFTPASKINVTATPSPIPHGTGRSTITVQLVNGGNTNVTQSGITIKVTVKGKWNPTLTYQGQTGSTVTVTTDSHGSAIIILAAGTKAEDVVIDALASGLTSGSATVRIT